MNKHILPLNLDLDMNINCFDFYKLSIVLSNDQLVPWFIERFINLQVNEHFECNYYELGSSSPAEYEFIFDEVLSTKKIIIKDNILRTTLKSLKENKYVLLTLNQRYYREYHKQHHIDSVHGTLFVGFDEEKEHLYFLDNINNKWVLGTLCFYELEQSFQSALDIIAKDDHVDSWLLFLSRVGEPASIFELKYSHKREVRLNILYDTFIDYLNGVESKSRDLTYFRWNGIAVYKSYYQNLTAILTANHLHEYFKPFRIHNIERGMRRILENKRGLQYRIKYLESALNMKFDEAIFKALTELHEILAIAIALYSKYFRKLDIKIIERANIYFKKAEELDVFIFTELSNRILNDMKIKLLDKVQ